MRFSFLLLASLLSTAACAASTSDAPATADGAGNEQNTPVGSAAFDYQGAQITITTTTLGFGMKFAGTVIRGGAPTAFLTCFVGSASNGGARISCGDTNVSLFTIEVATDASSATIGLSEPVRFWVESDPQANPVEALGLRGMARQSLAVGAHRGIDPMAIAARVGEAIASAGSIPTSAGNVTVEGWTLFDPELSLVLKSDRGKRYDCSSTADSPRLFGGSGWPESGLASASELAGRIQHAAEWAVGACTGF